MTVEDMLTETIICGSNEVNSVNGGDTGIGYGGGGDGPARGRNYDWVGYRNRRRGITS